MATQDYAASIQGVAIRVTRLDSSGNLLNGPGDSYTTEAFMRVSFTPEYEEGDEITEKSANGSVCVSYKAPDTLKRITMELAICEPDPELTALVSGGVLLRKNTGTFASPNNKSVGWASPAVGDDPSGNGVALEVWSLAIKDGKRAASLPYFQWVFPYVKLRQSGDRVIENGLLANTFEGFGLGNVLFSDGPDDRWEYPAVTDRPYSYSRASYAPVGLKGFYVWHGDLTNTITNKAVTANVATLTTGTTNNFSVGDVVTVTGITVNTALNGTFTILSKPTATTFTYAVTSADVTSAVQTPSGSATVAAGGTPVSDFTGQGSTTAYNVPGNKVYNPAISLDNIIASNKDPLV